MSKDIRRADKKNEGLCQEVLDAHAALSREVADEFARTYARTLTLAGLVVDGLAIPTRPGRWRLTNLLVVLRRAAGG